VDAVVGRGAELAAVAALLDRVESGEAAALVLEGEAGIGKTTLWEEGRRLAAERGFALASARPAESEASLPYAALADLLEPLLRADRERLPDAQRAALDAALEGSGASAVAVSRAALRLVQLAAERGRLLLAIDDVQWLDPPSESALAFVVRRLAGVAAGVLAARRSGEPLPAPLGLDRALGARLASVRVGPLSLGELDVVLRSSLGVGLSRPKIGRLHRACGGNPLYALEIARLAGEEAGGDEALPVPPQLGSVLAERVRLLPEEARSAALLASAALQPTVRLVERASGGSSGLAQAVEHDVLAVDRDRLRFTHPLLAAATYAAAPPWERREAHARLAGAADGALERAHQLARATEDPDEEVAAELEAAAELAAARGVPDAAADLAEHAARLTPPSGGRLSRLAAAATFRLSAGDPDGARETLEDVCAALPAGPDRARVLARLADVVNPRDPRRAITLTRQALEEAEGEPALAVEIHLGLGTILWNTGSLERSLEHVREAVRLAEQVGDDQLLAMSLGELLHAEAVLGLPFSREIGARALELERRLDDLPPSSYSRPSIELAIVHTANDRLDEARPLFDAALRRIEAAGDEAIRWGVLARLSDLELRAGNFAEALRTAREAVELVRLLDYPGLERYALAPYAAALAHVGALDDAYDAARSTLELSEGSENRLTALRALGTLGLVALSGGAADEAWSVLEPAAAELEAIGAGELAVFGIAQNAIDAAAQLGRLDDVERLAGWVEQRGRPSGRAWHRAIAARGRALAAAGRGDAAAARDALAAALAAHDELGQPFELGRTLLVKGGIERRARQRAAARATLERALQLFDHLGAPRFAEKAAAELARIPGRAPSAGELTETERRVAASVAAGLSNKQTAARLFVTVRTVEANLSRVYAKLGVRSRTELAARLGRHAPP